MANIEEWKSTPVNVGKSCSEASTAFKAFLDKKIEHSGLAVEAVLKTNGVPIDIEAGLRMPRQLTAQEIFEEGFRAARALMNKSEI